LADRRLASALDELREQLGVKKLAGF